jgi:uncharacterized protein
MGVLKDGWRPLSAVAGGLTFAVLAVLPAPAGAADASFEVRGSVEQVYATGVQPAQRMALLDRHGDVVDREAASLEGGVIFRGVKPGSGYRVRAAKGGPKSAAVRVLSTKPAPPDAGIYDQEIPSDGYGYLTTRDGIKLAIAVHPPTDVTNVIPELELPPLPAGPTPTLIEYSGYGYANPDGP